MPFEDDIQRRSERERELEKLFHLKTGSSSDDMPVHLHHLWSPIVRLGAERPAWLPLEELMLQGFQCFRDYSLVYRP